MIRMPGRRSARGRGQSLVEFALVAPIFFLLLFGVIQIGLVMASQNGLVDGVRNAARRAATYRINEGSFDATVWSSICATVKAEIDNQLSSRVIGYVPSRLTPSLTYEWQRDSLSGDYFLVAHVHATYANPLYVPLIASFLDGSDGTLDDNLTLEAGEQMRVENPALDTPAMTAPPC